MITAYTELEQLRRHMRGLVCGSGRRDAGDLTDCSLSVLLRLETGDLSPGELAELERVTPPSMNRTLNTLSAAGLVERHRDNGDGRRMRVTLTPAGAECARTARTRDAETFDERMREFRDDERAVLYRAVTVLQQLAER